MHRKGWRVSRRRGTLVLDLSHYVQRRDVTSAHRQYQRTQKDELSITMHDGDERSSMPLDLADWSDMADERVFRSQLRQRVFSAILSLPAIYRAPVMLRDIRGMSTEEASAMLRVKTRRSVAPAPRTSHPAGSSSPTSPAA